MAAPGVGARASGCLGFLSTLLVLASFLPTGSGFAITSIGNFAQCSPTVITWDIGQSLPPFTISITIVSGLTDDGPLLFTGFEGTSATVTLNLPAKTRVDLVLENSGGVLHDVSNLVVQPGTESDCANSALSGSVPAVAATNAGSSTQASDSSNGLRPGIIGATVTCSVLGFALVLWLLFWCKRRRQYQVETRHTRLHSPELREGSPRDSVICVETVQGLRPPSIVARDPNSPTSVNATIGLPSAEAMMEHRNKPLPTPTTPLSKARTGFPSSPDASSSSQPMTSPNFAIPTPTSFAMAGHPRAFAFAFAFAGRAHDSGCGLASDSVFDGSDASSDFTAPPPYDVYE